MLVYYVDVIENVYVYTEFLGIVVAWKCLNFPSCSCSRSLLVSEFALSIPLAMFLRNLFIFFVWFCLVHMMSHIYTDW